MKNLSVKSFKKFFLTKILRRQYYRIGECKCCGACCQNIYVKHAKGVISDLKEFEKLKKLDKFYTYLDVIGKDETGLLFKCNNLDEETHKCKIHNKRPGICRRYPQEELFKMGGIVTEECGYKLIPIVSFDEVLEKQIKKKGK